MDPPVRSCGVGPVPFGDHDLLVRVGLAPPRRCGSGNTPASRVKNFTTSSPNRCAICRGGRPGGGVRFRAAIPARGPRRTGASLAFSTSAGSDWQSIFTRAWAPIACHLGKSIPVNPSLAGARNEAGSSSLKRPLRSKSCASRRLDRRRGLQGGIGPREKSPSARAGPGLRRGRSRAVRGAARSNPARRARVMVTVGSSAPPPSLRSERARSAGGGRQLRLLDGEPPAPGRRNRCRTSSGSRA